MCPTVAVPFTQRHELGLWVSWNPVVSPSHLWFCRANRGIGFEIAKGLLKRGYQVHLAARSRDKAVAATRALKDELGSALEACRLCNCVVDVQDKDSISAAAAYLEGSGIYLDVLVCNAGVFYKVRAQCVFDAVFCTPCDVGLSFANCCHLQTPG